MRTTHYLLFLLLSVFSAVLPAQNPGDTIFVSALDYSNSSRDLMVQFPASSRGLSFEKIIMRYGMRCKNGLVSPPIAGQTNIGCGEWDYSCNTYMHDPTQADSTAASVNRYFIYPDTNTSNTYSTTPTWFANEVIQQSVNVQSVLSEDTSSVGTGTLSNSSIIYPINKGGKTFLLYTSAELTTAGLIVGNINRISFNNLGNQSRLNNLRVKMKHTSMSNLNAPDTTKLGGMQEVYYHEYTCNPGINIIPFHTPFNWNGTSNLLIELSYKGVNRNNTLNLECHNTTVAQAITSSNDYAMDIIPNNYAEADNYVGVSGSNSRTLEAWFKTTVATKDMINWGRNSGGRKFVLRLDGNGRIRLEINGGNIIGSRTGLADGEWHHVAITFNGSSTATGRIYVDGVRDLPSSTNTGVSINTDTTNNLQISRGFSGRFWDGNVDEVRVWSTDLADTTIANWRYRHIDATHPNYAQLELTYQMDSISSTLVDESPYGRNATYFTPSSYSHLTGEEHFKSFKAYTVKPNISLYQGTYNMSTVNDTLLDTTYYEPFSVSENTIYPNWGTTLSDSIGTVNSQHWPQNNIIYDLVGNVKSSTPSSNTVVLLDSTLNYFNRTASKLEIMSFVTPYGINLDLGVDGKAWYFDVTDFAPVLLDSRRMTLERGGQNQEEMDIDFMFIVGTPPRDVKSIQQIWPVTLSSYTNIQNNVVFANKTIALDTSNASQFKIRSAITGHGQQGEFTARTHSITLNGGTTNYSRIVWKECAENPIYPQGGTWIYDRAGWCPGMPTDIAEYDITSIVGNTDSVDVDYTVIGAFGTSNYIVNNQLVSYGDANHNLDARITEVISPTNHPEYGRENPVCNEAEIVIQNVGSTTLTSMTIEYWINGGTKDTYNWTGSLPFMDEATITLPTSNGFWGGLVNGNNSFTAEIINANNSTDQYSFNNKIDRNFEMTNVVPASFYVYFRTNNVGSESRFDVRDASGSILFVRTNMTSNTTYRDTLTLPNGCYSFNVYDSDDDGLDFFANSDGTGSVAMLSALGPLIELFNPDFGDGFSYNFSIGSLVNIEEFDLSHSISIYPNPASDQLTIETTGLSNSNWTIYDGIGRVVESSTTMNGSHHSLFNLDVSNYNNGIYFIHFNEKESTVVRKFVISR